MEHYGSLYESSPINRMSTYKEILANCMTELGKDTSVLVVGYNVCDAGGAGGGSFNGIPKDQRQEMPLAENLMMGAAIGLSLQGYTPLVWIERADFLTCCMDAIVNHLAKLSELSEGVHRPACIVRVVVGNSNTPLYTGSTHTQDFSHAMREMLCPEANRNGFKVERLTHKALIADQYAMALNRAKKRRESTMLFEFRDLYSI